MKTLLPLVIASLSLGTVFTANLSHARSEEDETLKPDFNKSDDLNVPTYVVESTPSFDGQLRREIIYKRWVNEEGVKQSRVIQKRIVRERDKKPIEASFYDIAKDNSETEAHFTNINGLTEKDFPKRWEEFNRPHRNPERRKSKLDIDEEAGHLHDLIRIANLQANSTHESLIKCRVSTLDLRKKVGSAGLEGGIGDWAAIETAVNSFGADNAATSTWVGPNDVYGLKDRLGYEEAQKQTQRTAMQRCAGALAQLQRAADDRTREAFQDKPRKQLPDNDSGTASGGASTGNAKAAKAED